tara:strand:- start:386 stop:898 length:513 start_codon:yes stop_codon:yes gene_type:complete
MATYSSGAINGAADFLPYLHAKATKNLGPVPTTRIATFSHTTTNFAADTIIQMVPVFSGERVVDIKVSCPADLGASGSVLDVGETTSSPATESPLVGVTDSADADRYFNNIANNGAYAVNADDCTNISAGLYRYTYTADDTIDIHVGTAAFDAAPTGGNEIVMAVTVVGG